MYLLFGLVWCKDFQISFLRELYRATNGDFWFDNSGWDIITSNRTKYNNLTMFQLCSSLNQSQIPFGLICDPVTKKYLFVIDLDANNLHGFIPYSICNFIQSVATVFNGNVQYISLNNNLLYRTLPDCLLTTAIYNTDNLDLNIGFNNITSCSSGIVYSSPT